MHLASLTARTPSVVVGAMPAGRPGRRATTTVCAFQDGTAASVQRRSMAAFLAALPVALPASRALALIPDDDDEELVEKARANRKSRLATEKKAEKAFSASEGFVDRNVQKELVPVQRAINSLALTGKQLASGEVAAAADTLSGGWAADLQEAAESLSQGAAKASAARMVGQLSELKDAANKGSLADAKKGYVALVGALQGWASDAGIAASLKGL